MHVVSQNSSNMTASESTDDDSEFNQIRVRQIVKKIIYGVKFIWISIGNLDPTIIFVILEWLLLVYWSRSISLVFLRGSPLDRVNHLGIPTAIDDEQSSDSSYAQRQTV